MTHAYHLDVVRRVLAHEGTHATAARAGNVSYATARMWRNGEVPAAYRERLGLPPLSPLSEPHGGPDPDRARQLLELSARPRASTTWTCPADTSTGTSERPRIATRSWRIVRTWPLL